MLEHSKESEALMHVNKSMLDASSSGHWMVAVWAVGNGGESVRMVNRTTWQFPRNLFLAAIAQLAETCGKEISGMGKLPDEPLPLAVLNPITEGSKVDLENLDGPKVESEPQDDAAVDDPIQKTIPWPIEGDAMPGPELQQDAKEDAKDD